MRKVNNEFFQFSSFNSASIGGWTTNSFPKGVMPA